MQEMSEVRIKRIEIENFKSFKGLNVIEKLKNLTAVIGPNGSGKSNFMDAICFAVGEKTSSLRMNKVANLVHGAVIDKPVSRTASVKIIFENILTSEEIVFQRLIRGNSSQYMCNNTVVSHDDYVKQLEKIGIITGASNCFVFQGGVESIAMKDPKDITKMLEEISGSAELKQQYDSLKMEVDNQLKNINIMSRRKKHLVHDCVKLNKQGKLAKVYMQNLNDLNEMLITHCLFKLFHNERQINNLETSLQTQQDLFTKHEEKVAEAEENLKTFKKNLGKCDRDLAKIEQEIREAEVDMNKKKSYFVKAKEEISYVQRKLDGALKTLENVRKADEAQTDSIRKLEEELAEATRAKREYEAVILDESQSQGIDLEMNEEYVREYGRLKSNATKRTALLMRELESIDKINRSDQDRLDNTHILIAESQCRFSQKQQEEKELERRINTLNGVIKKSEETLVEKRRERVDLDSEILSSRDHLENVQSQLEIVMEQIGDEKTNKYEEEHRKRKRSIVEQLQVFFKGVYGRLVDLCQPRHSRYNIAFTKVFGHNMEAIVVDTEHTARQCIKFLKEQRLGRETFLPVDYVQWKPVDNKLRDITEPKNVYLLYDLLIFEPQEIETVILYVVNNVLVCQTPEDAMQVAYNLGTRNNAVAIDGTYYQKSGIISGGAIDIAKKAKRWNEKRATQLKDEKDKLTEELKIARKNLPKESNLNMLDLHIDGLETRLKYFRSDLENTNVRKQHIKIELSSLADDSNNYKINAKDIQQAMEAREPKILELQKKLNSIEDTVFADFCKRLGISNIRQYEDRDLLIREKHKQKLLDLQTEIDKISNLLEFERNHSKESNVTRWVSAVDSEKQKLEKYEKHQRKMKDEMDTASQEVARLKNEHTRISQEGHAMKTRVNEAKHALINLNRNVQAAYKQVVLLESKIEQKKSERHTILLSSKIDALDVPLLEGTMEDIAESEPSQTSSLDISASARQYEKEAALRLDYHKLPKKMKDLVDEEEISKVSDRLLEDIQTKRDLLSKEILDTKTDEKLHHLKQVLEHETVEYNKMIKEVNKTNQAFDAVKKERLERFKNCFQHVSDEIGNIYRDLTNCEHAVAVLSTTNEEEPYLGDTKFYCIAPEKRFLMMTNMSGGEKTLAALSLVFAVHSYRVAPFLIFDEVDAALDKINVTRVAKYMQKKIQSMQIIVISLKKELFSSAELLIGLDSKNEDCLVSKFVTLDSNNYAHLF